MIRRPCEKCGGQLLFERDEDGQYYLVCLQCGERLYLQLAAPLPVIKTPAQERRERTEGRHNRVRSMLALGESTAMIARSTGYKYSTVCGIRSEMER